jgi:hypothetical protein
MTEKPQAAENYILVRHWRIKKIFPPLAGLGYVSFFFSTILLVADMLPKYL